MRFLLPIYYPILAAIFGFATGYIIRGYQINGSVGFLHFLVLSTVTLFCSTVSVLVLPVAVFLSEKVRFAFLDFMISDAEINYNATGKDISLTAKDKESLIRIFLAQLSNYQLSSYAVHLMSFYFSHLDMVVMMILKTASDLLRQETKPSQESIKVVSHKNFSSEYNTSFYEKNQSVFSTLCL